MDQNAINIGVMRHDILLYIVEYYLSIYFLFFIFVVCVCVCVCVCLCSGDFN